jgi:hypothetical protein
MCTWFLSEGMKERDVVDGRKILKLILAKWTGNGGLDWSDLEQGAMAGLADVGVLILSSMKKLFLKHNCTVYVLNTWEMRRVTCLLSRLPSWQLASHHLASDQPCKIKQSYMALYFYHIWRRHSMLGVSTDNLILILANSLSFHRNFYQMDLSVMNTRSHMWI